MSGAHVNKEYSILQVALNLAATCIISGLIIAVTYFITSPIAAQKNAMLKQQAMQDLIKNADSFKPVPNKSEWFAAEKAGKVIGYIVPSETKGYGGEIDMLVAVSTNGAVIDYNILTSNETPGLGSNASKDYFRDRFKGKKSDALKVVKDPSNNVNIQAMTGATITSTAVTKGVKAAVDQVDAFVGGK
jgi:electron transport complex protein RnfG